MYAVRCLYYGLCSAAPTALPYYGRAVTQHHTGRFGLTSASFAHSNMTQDRLAAADLLFTKDTLELALEMDFPRYPSKAHVETDENDCVAYYPC